MSSSGFFILTPICSIGALVFALYLALSIMREDEGNDKMKEIALAVRVGARAYLKRQYLGVALFFAVMFIILLWMASQKYLVIFVPFAFLTGGFFSGLSGFIGMTVATQSSNRTAAAAMKRPKMTAPAVEL
ncbi:MAG TPA: sodium/proton-translocating pyrophosphatase, partial [Candidatus Omnitrophota bacterium]|nr:sodium/proton-translocating pyrophosphatase [Candidatus Omnitrophota bacterium]